MADARSPEDVLAGVLRISVGGFEKEVPTLKIGPVRGWLVLLGEKLASIKPALALDPSGEAFTHVAELALDGILDLIVAYDKTAALGGRDWLEEHTDPAQLYAAVLQMGRVTLPFVEDGTTLITAFPDLFLTRAVKPAEPSESTSSTSGPSPTGDSTPAPSKRGSTRTS